MRLDGEDVLPLFEQQPVRLEVDQFGVATGMNRRRGVEGNRLIRLAGQASPGNLGAVQVGDEAVVVVYPKDERLDLFGVLNCEAFAQEH